MTGFFFFFRAVNNTFLQIPQLRKHKCEKETTARATEREKIKTRMGTGVLVHPARDSPK